MGVVREGHSSRTQDRGWQVAGGVALAVLLAASVLLPTERAKLLLACIRTVACPIVVLVVDLVIRERFADLIGRLRTAEVPGVRTEFFEKLGNQIERAVEDVREVASDVEHAAAVGSPQDGK
jgi:hypothetical protein